MIEIVIGYPPNYDKIAARFDIASKPVVFSYDGKLYNPLAGNVAMHLMKHEMVHAEQQIKIGGSELWWNKYLVDKDFRFNQEVEAYGVQYKYFCSLKSDQFKQRVFLNKIAGDLASPIYGSICTVDEAISVIKETAKIVLLPGERLKLHLNDNS